MTKRLYQGLDIRKNFFTVTGGRHWHRLHREVGNAPSLDLFKDHSWE